MTPHGGRDESVSRRFFGDPEKECTCSATYISRYQKRLSGPLLDRIDITHGVLSRHIEAPRVPFHTVPRLRLWKCRGGS
jgi:magnesium chelatase family protein